MSEARVVHAPPTGTKLTCKNWLIEAAYRMIQTILTQPSRKIPTTWLFMADGVRQPGPGRLSMPF